MINGFIKKFYSFPHGQAGIVAVLAIALVSVLVASGVGTMAIRNRQLTTNVLESFQSYYAAEAGIEDALLRIVDDTLPYQASDSLTVGKAVSSVVIGQSGSDMVVTVSGDTRDRIRKVSAVISPVPSQASFSHGVVAFDGGVKIKNNASVTGDLYSNGGVTIQNDATVTGSLWAANGASVNGLNVTGDVYANTITNSTIGGDAYYQSISGSTVAGTQYPGSPDPPPLPPPITDGQIAAWKAEAAAGGEISAYTLKNSQTGSLGPVKINGNLEIRGSSILTLTGTVWVTGDIKIRNNSVVVLDPSYGSLSGILIASGKITAENNINICGSEGYDGSSCNASQGSYILMIASGSGEEEIEVENNVTARAVFYASNGEVEIENNVEVASVIGYEVEIENNAVVTFDSAMTLLEFNSSVSGGWVVTSWREVE